MPTGPDKERVVVSLSRESAARLQAAADVCGQTKSTLVEIALAQSPILNELYADRRVQVQARRQMYEVWAELLEELQRNPNEHLAQYLQSRGVMPEDDPQEVRERDPEQGREPVGEIPFVVKALVHRWNANGTIEDSE